MNNSIFDIDYTRILPDILKNDENMLALGKIIAIELQKNISFSRLNNIYARIDELDEDLLDILSYDFHIDWYDTNYSIEEKRSIIKNSIKVHKHLGTKYALETALSDIYSNTKVEEWFDYGGEPYMFKIIINDDSGNVEKQKKVLEKVKFYKNLRSHLEEINYRMPVIRFQTHSTPTFPKFKVALSVYNGETKPILLNGENTLDGSWLLNQTSKGLNFARFAVQTGVKNHANIRSPTSAFYLSGLKNKNTSCLNSLEVKTNVLNKTSFQNEAVCFYLRAKKQEYSIKGKLKINSIWQLDGSVLLDGSRKLNAGITEEEL